MIRLRQTKWKQIAANLYLYLVLVFLYAPIAVIIIYSFTESKVLGNWTGFSTGLYQNLFSGHSQGATTLYSALINTVIIAVISFCNRFKLYEGNPQYARSEASGCDVSQ